MSDIFGVALVTKLEEQIWRKTSVGCYLHLYRYVTDGVGGLGRLPVEATRSQLIVSSIIYTLVHRSIYRIGIKNGRKWIDISLRYK